MNKIWQVFKNLIVGKRKNFVENANIRVDRSILIGDTNPVEEGYTSKNIIKNTSIKAKKMRLGDKTIITSQSHK